MRREPNCRPSVAVQQWQGNDPRRQQAGKFSGGSALCGAAAVGVHRRRYRTVQIDVTATGNPATEIAIGKNTLQDAGLRHHENQPRPVGGDLAEGGVDCVFSEYDELSEVPLDLDTLHSAPRRCLSRTSGHYPTSL